MGPVSRRRLIGAAGVALSAASVGTAFAMETKEDAAMKTEPQRKGPNKTGYVSSEGDQLYYEVHGKGRPLLMIPGGNGDAGFYSLVAPILADEFQVISYDRRGSSRSSRHQPQNPEMSQQARDAVAVLRAVGHDSAFVFGNSGGALIALEMARKHPTAVRAAVVHEPPLISVLPDAEDWLRFYAEVYLTVVRDGPAKAQQMFYSRLVLPSDLFKHIPRDFSERLQKHGNAEFLLRRELMPLTLYEADFDTLKKNKVRMALAAGKMSLDGKAHYALTAPIIAERLGCEMVVFPGHHNSYWDMPEEWSGVLRKTLHTLS
jgi:pimeloyl-ACP methyl ester carboxylesterase